jgi:acetyltransferase-like isoleucine patch superfamily enzyme
MRIFSPIKNIVKKLHHKIKINRYDNFTISEYFRTQGAQIGEDCYIAIRNLCTEPYLVKIGNHVLVAENVVFQTHDGGVWIFKETLPELRVFGPIVIEDNCVIGEGSQLFPNITIGKNSIIGAGSVVINDIPPDSIAMGVPARKIGSVEKYKQKCIERWKEQKPPNFHTDSSVPLWEKSKNVDIILAQLREHLQYVFKDILK